ncbi:MAG: hypothetical protein ONB41_03975 [candidate division KSB1 bacterium]|nr:hypothetical protein [candidate division KSB1 bacterium]
MVIEQATARIYKEIMSLKLEQQVYILNRLFTDMLCTMSAKRELDITGLRGLGKGIWQGLDAQEIDCDSSG